LLLRSISLPAAGLSTRSFARAFTSLILASIVGNCSSDLVLSDKPFVSSGAQVLQGELTGSVSRTKATVSDDVGEPRAELKVGPQSLPVPTAVEGAGTVKSIEASGAPNKPQVVLLRGLFGSFSTGLDSLAEELRSKGIETKVYGYLSWRAIVADILRERAAGKITPLVLVGHSQGANNVIAAARLLRHYDVNVDLLVTLAPVLPQPVPRNVMRAINYYQFPGWGSALSPDRGFVGTLSNINMGADWKTFHMNIDKSSGIHQAIAREIGAL
jgi:hypothetical protein